MGKDHKKLVGDPPLDKMITILPYCSHDKVLELLKSSHVLFLMLSGGEKDIVPVKIIRIKVIFQDTVMRLRRFFTERISSSLMASPQRLSCLQV